MLGADATAQVLAEIELDTGYPEIDRMITSLMHLCGEEIGLLLARRDDTLGRCTASDVLQDRTIEVLSEIVIDVDQQIARTLGC